MKLYKYTSLAVGEQILTRGAVRFTPPKAFNDPFELNPSFELFSKQDLARLPDAPDKPGMKILTPDALASMFEAIRPGLKNELKRHAGQDGAFSIQNNAMAQDTLNSELGILCLSRSAENLLMWAHYADNHQGIVIEFDGDHGYFREEGVEFGPVDYKDRRPILSHSNLRSPKTYFRKSTAWSYEEEWRCVRALQTSDQVFPGDQSAIHLFGLPPDIVTGVVIGCRVEHEDRVRLMDVASRPPLQNVTIYQTRLHNELYSLEVHPPLDGVQRAIEGRVCVAREADEF